MHNDLNLLRATAGKEAADDFVRQFQTLVNKLHSEDVEFCLIGGTAYALYYQTRNSEDLDFLLLEESRDTVESLIEDMGLQFKSRADKQIVALAAKNSHGIKSYDFMFSVGFTPEGTAIATAKPQTVLGVKNVPVVTANHAAALWAESAVEGHHRGYADLVVFCHHKIIDPDKVREIIKDIIGYGEGGHGDEVMSMFNRAVRGESLVGGMPYNGGMLHNRNARIEKQIAYCIANGIPLPSFPKHKK